MQAAGYLPVMWRTLLVTFYIAAIAVIGELGFVVVMNLIGHHVLVTSFFALVLFSGFLGLLPLRPSGSRISNTPVSLVGRLILVVECTAFVAAAIVASSQFMAYRHITVSVDIDFAAYIYFLVLGVMFIANFSRLRAEIRIARSTVH